MNHLFYTRKFKPVMCFLAAGVTILASVQSQDDDEEFDVESILKNTNNEISSKENIDENLERTILDKIKEVDAN